MILVLNDAYGAPELLPFDLKMRRVIRFHMPKDVEERASERKKLEGQLAEGIRTILNGIDAPTPGEPIQPLSVDEQAQQAIEAERPNQAALVRRYMTELAHEIAALTPAFAANEEERWDEQLFKALEASPALVSAFARLASSIAQMGAVDAGRVMYRGFAHILSLYTHSPEFRGSARAFDQDLARFLGHELFVSFCACLIQEERWALLADVLDEDLYARRSNYGRMEMVPFTAFSEFIRLLAHRNERLHLNRMSLHADLLYTRHTQGDLGHILPIESFIEADYLLYLRAQFKPTQAPEQIVWRPWSTLYMRQSPHYLLEAVTARYALQLLRPLGVADIPTLRTRFVERAHKLYDLWARSLGFWDYPLAGFDPETIGSR